MDMLKKQLDIFKFKDILNHQMIVQAFVAGGVTDLRAMSEILDRYIKEKHKDFKNDEIRITSRKERLLTKKMERAEKSQVQSLFLNSPMCPDCGLETRRLIQVGRDGIDYEVCADMTAKIPQAGCGYSKYIGESK